MPEPRSCDHPCCTRTSLHEHVDTPDRCPKRQCVRMTEARRRTADFTAATGIEPDEDVIGCLSSNVFP